ncbi:permease, glycerol uptake facilitator [Belliella baltica DSM 15883]|uniref:Permease, glycerol uptake facilitator n=1 Tax=Belliella baltica (strain DSM 15883 / CIP 108006 / LMG 21964 / BA134) TaxID=866536 RepID=I3Z716_BELBD|nr:MIP/aquaporin family protein [Belliella baltica]AFL85034.1 permease, glycerol uptake facilitator [Belliella baltica DSM 15883]
MEAYIFEFIGTAILLLMGTAVVANVVLKDTKGHNSGWIVITTGWALGVYIAVVVAGPYSGAHLNPAVTVSLAVMGSFDWALVPGYIIAQMSGAFIGAFLCWLNYKDHFDRTEDSGTKLAVFSTGPAIRNTPINFIGEVTGTFILLFVIYFITGAEIQSSDGVTPVGLGSVGAIPVAFLVWVIGLSLGGTTGYAINPARDLGPRIFHAIAPIKSKGSSDWGYAWIPVIGPIIGGVLAALAASVLL